MSQKSVAQKLLVRPGTSLWISSDEGLARLGPLPDGVRRTTSLGEAAIAVVFVEDEAALRAVLAEHRSELLRPGVLWFAYPKGGRADIDRDRLWPIMAELGMRPISQVAVDETWSALRFRRLAPGEVQFRGR
jgi:hypothetical protein